MSAIIEQDEVLEGDVIPIGGFDYSGWDKSLAEECREAADRIRRRLKRSAEDIIEIGQDLLRIKNRLDHGKWERWIEQEFGLTSRTANKMIAVAKRFGDRSELNSVLTFLQPVCLYELITQDTPPEAIEEVLKKSEKKVLTLKEVKQIKKKAQTALEESEEHWFKEKIKFQKNEKDLKNQLKVLEIEKKALVKNVINPAEVEKAHLEKLQKKATMLAKIESAKEILRQVKADLKEKLYLEVVEELKEIQSNIGEDLNFYHGLLT